MTAVDAPTDIDILTQRLPEVDAHLTRLGDGWHLWPDWTAGLHCALVRHLDGQRGADGRYCAVVPYIYTWAVIVGPYSTAGRCFDNRWCYHNRTVALAAAHIWDGQDEPVGWHRHPASGRRREDGDPARETYRP